MSRNVSISYDSTIVGAKEQCNFSFSDDMFGTAENLKKNMQFTNYFFPTERYNSVLDGTSRPLPNNYDEINIGVVSSQYTNVNGEFQEPLILTCTSQELLSTDGVTFVFDTANNLYANKLKISYYYTENDTSTIIHEETFCPDSSTYFCNSAVESFNKVVIVFYTMNSQGVRLHLHNLIFGNNYIFENDRIVSVVINDTFDPISAENPINGATVYLKTTDNIKYVFQQNQKLKITFKDSSDIDESNFYYLIESVDQISNDMYCMNLIGCIDILKSLRKYYVIDYSVEICLYDILYDICSNIGTYKIHIDESIKTVVLKQDDLMRLSCNMFTQLSELCFAYCLNLRIIGDNLFINKYDTTTENYKIIPVSCIGEDLSISKVENINSICVDMESIAKPYSSDEQYDVLYQREGIDESTKLIIDLTFDSSYISYNITTSGTNFKELHRNYGYNFLHYEAIGATGIYILGLKAIKSKEKRTRSYPVTYNKIKDNIKTYGRNNAITMNNIDNVLEMCYNYNKSNETVSCTISEKKYEDEPIKWGKKKWGTFKWGQRKVKKQIEVNVGDYISVQTPFNGVKSGVVTEANFDLNSNVIHKEITMHVI